MFASYKGYLYYQSVRHVRGKNTLLGNEDGFSTAKQTDETRLAGMLASQECQFSRINVNWQEYELARLLSSQPGPLPAASISPVTAQTLLSAHQLRSGL